MANFLEKKTNVAKAYSPEGEEKLILDHLKIRIPILKDSKKKILSDIDFEDIMKDADREYMPHSLREKKQDGTKVMLVQDEIIGLRGSRIVPITGKEGSEWRSDVSEPTLLVKIQTAISILVDQNPEAVFKALLDKYKPTSTVANAIWKRSWGVANSKEQLKNFIFNLAKYGWAPGRTYPKISQRDKEVLIELDTANPEKNKYKKVKITDYNDIYREALDPWRTWMDDMANLYDPESLDDWYFEKDFSRDAFELEFSQYSNSECVKFGQKQIGNSEEETDGNGETKYRDDVITLGFYESKRKDLYAIYSPHDDVIVYSSPLPNDEGMLSLWETHWNMRDPRTRYGIGLYEILKNNKVMYDRLDNMDIDSLVMSIYTMLFYSGSNQLVGDGTITVSPGLMKQKLPGTSVDQVKIDYTGKGREGAAQQMERMDETTGITPTLQGVVEGKTLGEVLHAKDAALKRLNIPLGNIASALETDAYLTLSWANQVYSLPEVMEFVDQKDMNEFMDETGRTPESTVTSSTGAISADFPRVLDLSLDADREGNLIESPENRFFVVGQEGKGGIPKKSIRWKGKISVKAQSIVGSSQELDRQRKLELFNLVTPVVQAIAQSLAMGQFQSALTIAKPVVQILEIQNEKPEDWLPDDVVKLLENPEMAKQMEQQAQMAAQTAQKAAQPLFVDPNAPPAPDAGNGATGAIPTAPSSAPMGIDKVAPAGQVTNPLSKTLSEIGKVK